MKKGRIVAIGIKFPGRNLTSMKKSMTRRVSALAAAAVAMVALTASPALASPSARATPLRALSVCFWWSPNGYFLGNIICEYGDNSVGFPNGTEEDFAVGTSHAVWTAWNNGQNGGGTWFTQSMGGSAYSSVQVVFQNGWQVEIAMQDSRGITHCDFRGGTQNSGWSGWRTSGC